MVVKSKGHPRLFQGNRSVGEILFYLARYFSSWVVITHQPGNLWDFLGIPIPHIRWTPPSRSSSKWDEMGPYKWPWHNEHRAIKANYLGLPQDFNTSGIFVDSDGYLSLRRGPEDVRPHVLKTNTIDVSKLVGLLTSTKSVSLSKRSTISGKVTKQAGYLEASRIVAEGSQSIPFEPLKFAASAVALITTRPCYGRPARPSVETRRLPAYLKSRRGYGGWCLGCGSWC